MNSMMKMCFVVLLFAAAKIFAQTNMPQEISTFQELNDKWNKALVDGDLNTLVDFYVDDAVSLPSYAPIMRGKDEIKEGNKKDLAATRYLSLTSKTTDVFGAGDVAIEVGTYETSLIPAKMTEPVKDHGKYLTVWQKQSDGSWKIKADTFNTDMNPMGQTQAGAKEKMMDENKNKDGDNDK
jgi:uncharacterized protein (TIGR02246 family)